MHTNPTTPQDYEAWLRDLIDAAIEGPAMLDMALTHAPEQIRQFLRDVYPTGLIKLKALAMWAELHKPTTTIN